MRPRGALVGAALLALAACGGGGDSATPTDAAAQARLQEIVNAAGAGAPILDCAGLDEPVPGSGPAVGKPAGAATDTAGPRLPEVTLRCLGGGDPVTLRDLRGPMVLNVWASWCGPCKDEIPYLIAAQAALGERVRFAAIAVADVDAASRQWLSFHGVSWPSLADPDSSIRGPLRIPGPPVTLFVRSDGTVAETHYGAFRSTGQVQKAIAEHLGVSSA